MKQLHNIAFVLRTILTFLLTRGGQVGLRNQATWVKLTDTCGKAFWQFNTHWCVHSQGDRICSSARDVLEKCCVKVLSFESEMSECDAVNQLNFLNYLELLGEPQELCTWIHCGSGKSFDLQLPLRQWRCEISRCKKYVEGNPRKGWRWSRGHHRWL